MANTSSTIKIVFDGATSGIKAAAAEARAAVKSVSDESDKFSKAADAAGRGFATIGKGMLAISAVSSAGAVLAGVAGAAAQLAPVALLLPAALLGGAAAMATFKVATAGMADAIGAGLSGDMKAFAKATKDMAPAARDTAQAFADLKPEVDALRKAVQQNFFAGLADQVQILGRRYLPILRDGMAGIATEFNAAAKQAARFLDSAQAVGSVNNVFRQTREALRNMAPALANILDGFLMLGNVGASYLPRLGTAIGDVTQRFRDWAQEVAFSGDLNRMIDTAITGFKDLGAILGNLGSIGSSVFGGLGLSMESPLAALRDLTAQLAAFLKTAESQQALGVLGETLATVGAVVRDVLMEALRQLGPIIIALGPVVQEVARAIGDQLVSALQTVGPLLVSVARFLSDHKEVVAALAPALVTLWAAFKLFSGIKAIAVGIEAAVVALGGIARVVKLIPPVALGAIAIELDKINVAAAGGDPAALTGMEDNLHNLLAVAGELAAGNIGGLLDQLGREWQMVVDGFTQGTSPIGAAAHAVGQFFSDVGRTTSDFVATTGQSFAEIGGFVASLPGVVGTAVADFATTVGTAVGGFFAGLPAQIGAALSGLGLVIATVATDAWNSFIAACVAAFEPVRAFFAQSPYEMGFALGTLIGELARIATDAWNAFTGAIVAAWEATLAFFTSVPQQTVDTVAPVGPALASTATSAWNAFTGAIVTAWNATLAFLASVPQRTMDGLAALGTFLANVATTAWNAFTTAITTAWNATIAFIVSVPGKIRDGLAALVGILRAKATEGWNSFTAGITAAWETTRAFVASVPGKIQSAIGNLGNLLVGAGRAVIDGLLAGIKAGYNNMINFVKGIAAGIAANKGPLSYDKTVLVPAGLALMSGLLSGLRTGQGNVLSFVGGIADGIAGTLGGASGMVNLGVNAAGVSITDARVAALEAAVTRLATAASAPPPQVRVFIGDQELTALVRVELADANRATARDVLSGSGVTY